MANIFTDNEKYEFLTWLEKNYSNELQNDNWSEIINDILFSSQYITLGDMPILYVELYYLLRESLGEDISSYSRSMRPEDGAVYMSWEHLGWSSKDNPVRIGPTDGQYSYDLTYSGTPLTPWHIRLNDNYTKISSYDLELDADYPTETHIYLPSTLQEIEKNGIQINASANPPLIPKKLYIHCKKSVWEKCKKDPADRDLKEIEKCCLILE